jgi:hypothetical protein
MIRPGCRFPQAVGTVSQQDPVACHRCPVNVSRPGFDSLLTYKSSFSAIRLPNSLPNSSIRPNVITRVLIRDRLKGQYWRKEDVTMKAREEKGGEELLDW